MAWPPLQPIGALVAVAFLPAGGTAYQEPKTPWPLMSTGALSFANR
jgi:hypothetical protein